MKKVLGMIAFAGIAASAQADFTITAAGPYVSDGAAGAAANGVLSFVATESGNFNRIRIQGTATSGGVGSYLSELRYRLTAEGGNVRDSGAFSATQTWGSAFVDNSSNYARFSFVSGSSYNINFWESYNDSGVDATWTNLSFTFYTVQAPSAINLGNLASLSSIDTVGSDFDTELGLYDAAGNLLANNDDIVSGNLQSALTGLALANGTYYIAVAGYNSGFGATDWGVAAGSAAGNYNLNLDGLSRGAGALASGAVQWYSFSIPTPGVLAVLGMGGLVGLRRRAR